MRMRLAPLVPKPNPTAPSKGKAPQRPFNGYVGTKVPLAWETTFSNSPSLSKNIWGPGVPMGILPKLEVGAVNDPLEREADAIADQVMRMPAPNPETSSGPAPRADAELDGDVDDEDLAEAPTVGGFAGAAAPPGGPGFLAHRKCATCEADEEDELRRAVDHALVMRECESCEDEDEIRRACASCDVKEDEEIRREPAPTIHANWTALASQRMSTTDHTFRLAQAAEWTPPLPG